MNGTDDEGTWVLTDHGSIDATQGDAVFFLDGDRPRPAPMASPSTLPGAEIQQNVETRDKRNAENGQEPDDQPKPQ